MDAHGPALVDVGEGTRKFLPLEGLPSFACPSPHKPGAQENTLGHLYPC